jgi:hypothetical protein
LYQANCAGGGGHPPPLCVLEPNMSAQADKMSLKSAFAWLAGAFTVVLIDAAFFPGLTEDQVIALSDQASPLVA